MLLQVDSLRLHCINTAVLQELRQQDGFQINGNMVATPQQYSGKPAPSPMSTAPSPAAAAVKHR